MRPPARSRRRRREMTGSRAGSAPRPWRRREQSGTSCASSANLFAIGCCPPRVWIDGSPVFTKLDIENRLARARTGHNAGSNLRAAPHDGNRLSGQYELTDLDRNPIHARQDYMIPAAGIQDQEFAVGTIGRGVDHPAIAGRGDLGARPGDDGNALLVTSAAIRSSEIA